MIPAIRTSAVSSLPTSLRATFSRDGYSQDVAVRRVVLRNESGVAVYFFKNSDITQLKDGSYEVILPAGMKKGTYHDMWDVSGVNSRFDHIYQFTVIVEDSRDTVARREPI